MLNVSPIIKSALKQSELESILELKAVEFRHDPYGFVIWSFPWGEANTPLENYQRPEDWQCEILQEIGDKLLNPYEAIRVAIASGHGIGKSALISMVILWAMCTCPDTRGVVTAGKDDQLKTKTWPELTKWHGLCEFKHWFTVTATAIYSTEPEHEKTWRIDAQPWNAARPEAFAGLHNKGRRILLVFDEGAAVDDIIWETAEGALTDADTEIFWLAFSNPTKNTGKFRECFGKFRHRWINRQIDSRSVSITNKTLIKQWVEDYGEDSDFVRVRVRGVFPRVGSMQFISSEIVEDAVAREAFCEVSDPFVIGVDVARFGDDQTVICFRKGRDATIAPWVKLRGADTMQVASKVAELYQHFRADALFVDEGGLGAGVVDRLRQLRVPVVAVQFGGKPDRGVIQGDIGLYANKRAEMWGNMREWLKGGTIPDDPDLKADCIGVEYGYDNNNAILLERKQDMKKRGLASPDCGDALALTFAHPVMKNIDAGRPGYPSGASGSQLVQTDYDPYASED